MDVRVHTLDGAEEPHAPLGIPARPVLEPEETTRTRRVGSLDDSSVPHELDALVVLAGRTLRRKPPPENRVVVMPVRVQRNAGFGRPRASRRRPGQHHDTDHREPNDLQNDAFPHPPPPIDSTSMQHEGGINPALAYCRPGFHRLASPDTSFILASLQPAHMSTPSAPDGAGSPVTPPTRRHRWTFRWVATTIPSDRSFPCSDSLSLGCGSRTAAPAATAGGRTAALTDASGSDGEMVMPAPERSELGRRKTLPTPPPSGDYQSSGP